MKTKYQRLKDFKNQLMKRRTIREKRVCQILDQLNIKYHEEQIISPYIVDFYLPSRNLILEIDGSVHNLNIQKEKDYQKDDYLMSIGIMVQRFKNECSDEFIIKKLLEYPQRNKDSSNRTYTTIHQINSLFDKPVNFSKANDIREIIIQYSKKIFKRNGPKKSFMIKKAHMHNCCGLRDKYFK